MKRWLALLVLMTAIVVAAAAGGAPEPVADLWSHDPRRVEVARQIFLDLRLWRVLAGWLVGAALAASGAALQAVFRNPLAEPYLLGISAGGALGATAGVALRLPPLGFFEAAEVLAFVGAAAAAMLIYWLGARATRGLAYDRSTLLLTGVALSAFLSALMSLIVALSNRLDLAQQTLFWLLGGLTHATGAQDAVLGICLAGGLLVLLLSARDLNALQLSDEEAASLGVEVKRVHLRLLLAAALMSAAAVAAAGLIGFVGLLAPHGVRLLFGNNARALVPAAALGGGMLLVACDALARSAFAPLELPVGIITALVGVPLFLVLMRRVLAA